MATYFINGDFLSPENAVIHVSDLALLRGYGIFDFFRAIDGKPIFLEDHLDRFENSAHLMGLNIPFSRQECRDIIFKIIEKSPNPMLGVKLILTGGYSSDGYVPAEKANFIAYGAPFTFKPADYGMKVLTHHYIREIPEIKTLNYVVPIRHLPQLKAAGADDVLYYFNGNVSELSRSNIFIVKNDKIATPTEGVLYGITRKKTLAIAQQHFEVEERAVTLAELLDADEIFTTGSTKRVTAIVQVDGKTFPFGNITRKLQELLINME
jgi:D-alanine transaminase/branched-chain amino acid aminotransferase